jgi:hypothetical protein
MLSYMGKTQVSRSRETQNTCSREGRGGRGKKETIEGPQSGSSRTDVPASPFATLAARSSFAIPTCPRGRRGQGTMLNHRVGRRVSVSQGDQFQHNGVILDRRSGVWNDDTGAVSRGGVGRLYWHL